MVQRIIPELSNGEFERFVKGEFVVVSFFKEWCMNCLMMNPIFEEASEKFLDKIKFAKINVEDNREIMRKFEINSTPYFIIFKGGCVCGKFGKTSCVEEFEEKLKEFLIKN